jgi:hypothetical protein
MTEDLATPLTLERLRRRPPEKRDPSVNSLTRGSHSEVEGDIKGACFWCPLLTASVLAQNTTTAPKRTVEAGTATEVPMVEQHFLTIFMVAFKTFIV